MLLETSDVVILFIKCKAVSWKISLSLGKHLCTNTLLPKKKKNPTAKHFSKIMQINPFWLKVNLDIGQFILFDHDLESFADHYLKYDVTSFCSFSLSKCDSYWAWYITVVTLFSGSMSFRDQLLPTFLLSIVNDRQGFIVGSEVVQWSLSSIAHRSFFCEGQLAHILGIFAWVARVSASSMLLIMTNNTHCWSTIVGRLRVLNSSL